MIERSAQAGNTITLLVAVALLTSNAPALSANRKVLIPLTVTKGVTLRIKLQNRLPIKKAGLPVVGRLTAPVYVYDRPVIPAGTEVLGSVTEVRDAPRMVRARAILNGSFTPLRTAQVEFDTLVLKNGKRIPIATQVMPGAAPAILLVSRGKDAANDPPAGLMAEARETISEEENRLRTAIHRPDKKGWLKEKARELVAAEIPYHRQSFQPGTVFTAKLLAPLSFGVESLPATEVADVRWPPPPDSLIRARLATAIDSSTAHPGNPVRAVVTQPLFSAKRQLIIPEGSRLEGVVIQAKAARRLHRNGRLRFTFQHIEFPSGRPEVIHASVERIEAAKSSHLRLDSEGGAAPAPSKKKYLAPALSLFLAVQAATPDRDAVSGDVASAAPGQGGAVGKVLAGGWGFGLVGSAISLAVKARAVTAAFGFYGAAWSIYSNLLMRGQNVAFPAGTPIEIRLGSHWRPGSSMPLPSPSTSGVPKG
ncbi:MAG: hypothetical protein KGM47_15975 [Acidobacteriota bacterium]|nr:hypothetical protein [Acidobacteriota bacterium]